MKSTRGFKREVRWSHLPEEINGKHRAFVKPLLQARQQAQTKLRTELWRHCQHERSQTRVLDSMLVTARATGGKMVSLPKEANREARFNMAVERARAKERKRAIQQFRQTAAGDVRASISHHCVSIDTLADDVLRTPDLGCDAWEFAPDVSTQCEKVMTFATEQNQWGRNHRAEECRMAGDCLCGAGGGNQGRSAMRC